MRRHSNSVHYFESCSKSVRRVVDGGGKRIVEIFATVLLDLNAPADFLVRVRSVQLSPPVFGLL